MASASALITVQKLYIAYYGRPADAGGQQYWAGELDKANGSPAGIINNFAEAPEAKALYGAGTTTIDRVSVLYLNILGRAPDAAGLAYYASEVSNGRMSLGNLALAILDGVKPGTSDAPLADNRLVVAEAFTAKVSDPNYGGDSAAAIARTFLKQVTGDAASATLATQQLPAYLNTIGVASKQPEKFANLIANGQLSNTAIVSATLTETTLDASIAALQTPKDVDKVPPNLTITDNVYGTASDLMVFTFTFSEPVTGFGADAITVRNGSKGAFSGSGSTYTLRVTPNANSTGQIEVAVAANSAQDAAGNGHMGARAVRTYDTRPDNFVLELSELASTNGGFVINGEARDNYSGYSVSAAGDVNRDGLDDVIIGAAGSDGGSGRSYVVFGKQGASDVNLSSVAAGDGGFVIKGEVGKFRSGTSVSDAGDVNGDGYADLIVGAYYSLNGSSYVVFGKEGSAPVDLGALGNGGVVINGQASSDFAGLSVSAAGDINGDGFADLFIGAPQSDPTGGSATNAGRSYVVYGSKNLSTVNLATLGSGGLVIKGEASTNQSGTSVSAAGDVNGDGLPDLIVGAENFSDVAAGFAGSTIGRSYVVFGQQNATEVDLSEVAKGNGGFVLKGERSYDHSGASVSAAGDVNGDGLADLIVGAPLNDLGKSPDGGRSYVVFGKKDTTAIDLAAVAAGTGGFAINGAIGGAGSGWRVSTAGDVNGDGLADLLVGAHFGRSYVVFGKDSSSAVDLAAVARGTGGFAINQKEMNSTQGHSVSAAGDVNGDGLADLLIGSPGTYLNNQLKVGRSHVIFGDTIGAFKLTAVDEVGTAGNDLLSDNGFAKSLVGNTGNDQLSATAASVLYGGSGDDTFVIGSAMLAALQSPLGRGGNLGQLARIDGGSGIDTIRLDGNGLVLDLTQIANQAASNPDGGSRIDSIERIDLKGNGHNLLKLAVNDVIDMAGFNTFEATGRRQLLVQRDMEDQVAFVDAANWSLSVPRVTLMGTAYDVYHHASAYATVYVEAV